MNMPEQEQNDISKKIVCMEKKVDRVLRAIEGDKSMGQEGLANQVRHNRESIRGMTEKIQWQDKKIAGWAGFMGAFGALLGFIGAIATGIIRGMMD